MPGYHVGLMSGTSLDGIDAVAVDFEGAAPRLLASRFEPYDPALRDALLALQDAGANEIHRAALAANQLAHAYAAVVSAMLAQAGLTAGNAIAIGCHGQTVRHQPHAGYTTQLINAALLAELTGIDTVADFRSRDIAAGGEGAPLVPAFHQQQFQTAGEHRVIVNIGGIANLTDLPPAPDVSGRATVTGFDCGPGNVLLDGWMDEHRGQAFDADGAWAAGGQVQEGLLTALLAHDFFAQKPPKSTGRETFNLAWVRQNLRDRPAPQDVQATLLEVTAQSIVQAITRHCAGAQAAYVCGGGVHNSALMARLAAGAPNLRITSTAALGLHPDWVEATAFAWLAREALARRPGNLPAVTGARGPRVLGALYASGVRGGA